MRPWEGAAPDQRQGPPILERTGQPLGFQRTPCHHWTSFPVQALSPLTPPAPGEAEPPSQLQGKERERSRRAPASRALALPVSHSPGLFQVLTLD